MSYLFRDKNGDLCAAKTLAVIASFTILSYICIFPIFIKDLPTFSPAEWATILATFQGIYGWRSQTKAKKS